jgi:hypothetical protein
MIHLCVRHAGSLISSERGLGVFETCLGLLETLVLNTVKVILLSLSKHKAVHSAPLLSNEATEAIAVIEKLDTACRSQVCQPFGSDEFFETSETIFELEDTIFDFEETIILCHSCSLGSQFEEGTLDFRE